MHEDVNGRDHVNGQQQARVQQRAQVQQQTGVDQHVWAKQQAQVQRHAQAQQQAKRDLRARMLAARNNTSPEERAACDVRIVEQVHKLSAYQAAELIFAYMPTGSEVDICPLVEKAWDEGKQVAFPRCKAQGQLSWHCVESFDQLQEGAYHILEPTPELPTMSPHDGVALCLVPGVAFDVAGFRIGYGGGYYDRFLYDFPGTSVGIVRDAQLVKWLDCVEAHDRAVDIVCCERRAILV